MPIWVCAGELDIHGYGTIGAVHVLDSGAQFIRDVGQPHGASKGETVAKTDSRFGLQLDYAHNNDLSFTIQALSKYQADATYTPEIAWAFAKYTIAPGLDLKVGRTKLDFIFQSDTVNLGYPSLTVRPPSGVYAIPLSPSDGFDIDYTVPFKQGYLTNSLNIGWATKDDIPLQGTYFNSAGSPLFGGSINYDAMEWSVKLGYGQLKPNSTPSPVLDFVELVEPLSPELAESLRTEDKWIQYYSLGGTWNKGNWRGAAAIGQFTAKTRVIPTSELSFFNLGYNIARWTPYISVSKFKSVKKAITLNSGTAIDSIAETVQSAFLVDQTSYSIGTRYDLTDNIALKAQYDVIDNDPDKTVLTPITEDDWDGRMQLLTFVLDYYF